jgi:hypothetical protein
MRGWSLGWPKFQWAKSIEGVLLAEAVAARAALLQEQERERAAQAKQAKDAEQEAINTMAVEGKLLGAGRNLALGTLAVGLAGLPAMRKMVEGVVERVTAGEKMSVKDTMQTVRYYATAVAQLANASKILVETERRTRGEPGELIGVQVSGEMSMSLDDALSAISEANETVELARSRGLLDQHTELAVVSVATNPVPTNLPPSTEH